jgi:hypothetical protein
MSTDSSILIICGCWRQPYTLLQKAQRQQISHHTDNIELSSHNNLENKGETEEEVENYSDAFHKILLEENTAIIQHYIL